ncbi:unnamed protein product, partial [Symbiodinium necroappetens]
MSGRHGRRVGPPQDADELPYESRELPIDEGQYYSGPLIITYGAEEMYNPSGRTGAVRQKGHSCMPAFIKKRFYDVNGTQVTVDVRG